MSAILAILGAYSPIPDISQLKEAKLASNITAITNNGLFSFFNNGIGVEQPIRSDGIVLLGDTDQPKQLIDLYRKLGFVAAVKSLKGSYAIVLADGPNIYIARDRIGVKPLYISGYKPDVFYLCSVPHILASCCEKVVPFPPGMIARYTRPSLTVLEKETLQPHYGLISFPVPKISETLWHAVERCMEDKPHITCFLSGGLGSSIIASLLRRYYDVTTYCVGVKGSGIFERVRNIAKRLKIGCHEICFTQEEGIAAIPKVIRLLGTNDLKTVRKGLYIYFLTNHVTDKVVMTGDGSYEVFEDHTRLKNLHMSLSRILATKGLEGRYPFLDNSVVDIGLSISENSREFLENAFRTEVTDIVQKDDENDYVYIHNHAKTLGLTESEWYETLRSEGGANLNV